MMAQKEIFCRIRRTCWFVLILVNVLQAQEATLSGRVTIKGVKDRSMDASGVVVWLTPVTSASDRVARRYATHFRLIQKNKHFQPHLTVLPVGSAVEFPNLDPWFHNVFSLFEGKRFDLGLYEAGATRTIHFDKPGVSYIFCNIHPEMSAVVVAVPTPFYAISDRNGEVSITHVFPGRYVLHFWHESATPEELDAISREVEIAESHDSFGVVMLSEHAKLQMPHQNKYGQEYEPPNPSSPVYTH